jgi:hypothetical protein
LERYQRERDARSRPADSRSSRREEPHSSRSDQRRHNDDSNDDKKRENGVAAEAATTAVAADATPAVAPIVPAVAEKLKTDGDEGSDEFLLEKIDPEVLKMMGLPVEMHSTKGEHVDGADESFAKVFKKRKYRQYMNRRLGPKPIPGAP